MKMPILAVAALSVVVSFGARAAAAEVDDFVAGCLSSLNWDKPMCECAAKKGKAELTPRGFEFQVASFRKDDAATERLRSKMEMQELVKSATFMLHAGKACAKSSGRP